MQGYIKLPFQWPPRIIPCSFHRESLYQSGESFLGPFLGWYAYTRLWRLIEFSSFLKEITKPWSGDAERLELVVLSCSTCALLHAEHKHGKSHTIYLSAAALFLGINLFMIACLVEARARWCGQNVAALSPIVAFCCNIHYMEASLRKPRRRVKGVRAGFLALSPTYELERLRQERRDRKILNTMLQKMVPAALGLSILGLPDFVLDCDLHIHAQELHLEIHTYWVHMLANQRWW